MVLVAGRRQGPPTRRPTNSRKCRSRSRCGSRRSSTRCRMVLGVGAARVRMLVGLVVVVGRSRGRGRIPTVGLSRILLRFLACCCGCWFVGWQPTLVVGLVLAVLVIPGCPSFGVMVAKGGW